MISPATILLLASPLLAAAAQHEGGGPAHRQRAALARGAAPAEDVLARDTELVQQEKRGNTGASGGRATFYDTSVGLGSCGVFHPNSEFTVAVNSGQLNAAGGGYPNPLCGSTITISYGGKTTQATVQDECPTCPWGGLDLSMGLFSYFADQGTGVIYVDWWYGGSAPAPAPAPDPTTTTPAWTPDPTTTTPVWVAPKTTTKAWTPDPTTTTKEWVAPTTTTPAWTPEPTTTSATPTTTSTTTSTAPTTSSAIQSSSSAAASSSSEEDVPPATLSGLKNAAPSASATPAAINNLEALGSFANGLGRVVCNGNQNCA